MLNIFKDFIVAIITASLLSGAIGLLYIISVRRNNDAYFRHIIKKQSSQTLLGGEASILRQRIFVNHTPKAQKMISEEFTINSNTDNVSNIVLQFTKFLPNLTAYDESGDVLPLMTNELTRAMISDWGDRSSDEMRTELNQLLDEMESQSIYVVWIKLPTNKIMSKDSNMVLKLEYDVEINNDGRNLTILISSVSHNVFYTLTKPEDYNFQTTQIIWYDNKDKMQSIDSWDKDRQDKLYSNKTHDAITLTSKPEIKQALILNYSFFPKKSIIILPVIGVMFLISFSSYFLSLQLCHVDEHCILVITKTKMMEKSLEIGIFIITASLVLPRLVHNHLIRYGVLLAITIPIALGVIIVLMAFR